MPRATVIPNTDPARDDQLLQVINFRTEIATDRKVPTSPAIQAGRSVLPFLIPTLERVELTDPDGNPVKVEHNNLIQIAMRDPEDSVRVAGYCWAPNWSTAAFVRA